MPKGFQRGNKLGVGNRDGNRGRKGYEIEKKQLDQMRSLLATHINLMTKVQSAKKYDPKLLFLIKKLEVTQATILKFTDKLHASKGEMKQTIDLVEITNEDQVAANKAILDYIKNKKK